MFSQYLMLNIRFTTIAYIAELGHDQQEAQEWLPGMQTITQNVSRKELKEYICEMLRCALELREQASKSQSHNLLRQALEYIDHNFTDENLSLKEVAGYTNVSANYFSAMFSQEMRQTFVEYLTQKRMNRAKELLRQSEKRTAEIAAEVGYKDPHYFSFVFRKTQGCTPRDYRTGGKRG
jgi:two-component system response regulator YesN